MTGSTPEGTRRALTLFEAAACLGAFAWIERRLFELTGAWAAAPSIPDGARAPLFTASALHAWHAELWEERLPVLSIVDRESLVRPFGTCAPDLLDALAPKAAEEPDEGAAGQRLLVGLARVVLPALLGCYEAFGEQLTEVADGPSIRALSLVLGDTVEERAWIDHLVETVWREVPLAERSARVEEELRGCLDPCGGELFPWSEREPGDVVGRGDLGT